MAAPSLAARSFHATLAEYRTTPVHNLCGLARVLGVGSILVKDETDRLGLPSFKILGASWAVEQVLRKKPDTRLLVAASAGNHGRAVAHVAALRGLDCRVYLPRRSSADRRAAIAAEGASVVVDGDYEDAVAEARVAGRRGGVVEIADVGEAGPARDVIDGYATLFAEAHAQDRYDIILVPVGVGSLAAAAAQHGAASGLAVIGVEPIAAACLTASLAAGRPARVQTPGTSMAGLDCAQVSLAAWPTLRHGISGTITITDDEDRAAMLDLAACGCVVGESGAAPLAALRALVTDPSCTALGAAVGLRRTSRILLVATEGPTDPASYRAVLAYREPLT